MSVVRGIAALGLVVVTLIVGCAGGRSGSRAEVVMLASTIGPIVLVEKNTALLRFAAWLVAEEAQRLIRDFGVDRYGAPLFFPNSEEWRKKRG